MVSGAVHATVTVPVDNCPWKNENKYGPKFTQDLKTKLRQNLTVWWHTAANPLLQVFCFFDTVYFASCNHALVRAHAV